MYTNIIGLTAAALTTIAFLPQAIKTVRLKSTDDLSPAMFFMLFTGVVFWLIYGILIKDLPIILANCLTMCFSAPILYYIFKKQQETVKIEHIALWVEDLETMKEFYCVHFNGSSSLLYHNSHTGFTSYFIRFNGKTRIELMHKADATPNTKFGHISISVGSKKNVDKKTNYFKECDFKIEGAPRTTGDGYYESVIQDPEGNLIEITV